jgi:hypothetical protein
MSMTTRNNAATPLAYVYDGREIVGFILARGRSGFEALDRDEKSLGFFKTAPAAANAVFDAAANEEGAG